MGVSQLAFLVRAAHPRARIVELSGVESRRHADVVLEPAAKEAMNAQAHLAPGRRNDAGLDFVALDAVVRRRFVGLVKDAERNQEEPAFDVGRVVEPVVELGLLDLGLATIPGAYHAMLDLEL